MSKKQEEHLLKMFSKAFHEVVPPLLEDLAKRKDVQALEKKLDSLENGQDTIEQTLTKIENHLDRIDENIDNHSYRVEKLEKIHPQGKHFFPKIA